MTNYWIIGTGSSGKRKRLWKDFSENNRIRINFSIEEDLSHFIALGVTALEEFVHSRRPDNPQSAGQCRDFCAEMVIGDLVIARKGILKIVGFGKVTSDYQFDRSLDDYRHIRSVEWRWLGEKNWDGVQLQSHAVVKLTEADARFHDLLKLVDPQNLAGEEGFFPEEIPNDRKFNEGLSKTITVNRYERDPMARRECIRYHGTKCAVCRFSFEEEYGPLGEDFIHVHHIVPLATIGEQYEIDPAKDLRPVCPNCHAMLHKKNPPLSIDELKYLYEEYSKA